MSEPPGVLSLLSLGAGVQSTTLYLMALHGELHLDGAIFADTQWEPAAVYEHLAWLETLGGPPIHRVTVGSLRERTLNGTGRSGRFASLPFHIRNIDGKAALGKRQCTAEYKIEPICRAVRQQLARLLPERPDGWANPVALTNAVRARRWVVDQAIGISLDEWQRMGSSRVAYIRHVYPLVSRRMTRADCLVWMGEHGYPRPPRSACIGCPFRSNEEWRALTPAEFADAVAFDRDIRQLGYFKGELYLHDSLVPLDQADLSDAPPAPPGQLQMFEGVAARDCMGLCAV